MKCSLSFIIEIFESQNRWGQCGPFNLPPRTTIEICKLQEIFGSMYMMTFSVLFFFYPN